jgi:predicted AAA+ superfamily ATPase
MIMEKKLLTEIERIATALERLSPLAQAQVNLNNADAFVWEQSLSGLQPVTSVKVLPLSMLKGIDDVCETLLANTERFVSGKPANNALLWGARGMGKSSLVKAVWAHINQKKAHSLMLVEIHREDITQLSLLLKQLATTTRRCIIFCDDLSFEAGDQSYKSLKAVLEGGIAARPENVLLYATSNRRHLMPREMMENERSTAINPDEAVQEKVSLSDRFGLWLGFHQCSQDTYLEMIDSYAAYLKVKLPKPELHAQALEWAITRGARSGRVAWQFMQSII